jgi:hypothetical protein
LLVLAGVVVFVMKEQLVVAQNQAGLAGFSVSIYIF